MRKYTLFYVLFVISALTLGCSAIQTINPKTEENETSITEVITQCLIKEATNQIQSGAAYATSVRSTAKEITSICWKNVVPEAEKTNDTQEKLLKQAIQITKDLLVAN